MTNQVKFRWKAQLHKQLRLPFLLLFCPAILDIFFDTDSSNRFASAEQQGLNITDVKGSHCALAVKDWCGSYYAQTPIPAKSPPRGDKSCPGNCRDVGNCDYDTGRCYCSAGYDGADCSEPRKRPCFHMDSSTRRDKNLQDPMWSQTRCPGVCDEDIAMCWCPPETKYGVQPPAHGIPRWSFNATRRARPFFWCHPSTDPSGNKLTWGPYPWPDLMSKEYGWCEADLPKFKCICHMDGLAGDLCNIPLEHFCINQCSGHGLCYLGFCKCHDGWYGHDCSRKRAGMRLEPGDEERRKPWLKHALQPVPAAMEPAPGSTRLRPLIYVYDLRPEFNTDLLQYRLHKEHCTYRIWNFGNSSSFVGYNAYALETVLHEMLLTSQHRTFDPEEADYFYVPIYSNCYFDVHNWNPKPIYPANQEYMGNRPFGAAHFLEAVQLWLDKAYPYWGRNGGRDHIFLTAHDEGACYVPSSIWNSTFLTHWGKLDFPHSSHTSYGHDDYNQRQTAGGRSKDWLTYTSRAHPCYDPNKDLVIPVHKQPAHYGGSIYFGNTPKRRDILLSFRGDIGIHRPDPRCLYSRCVRQRLYNLTQANGWETKYNILINYPNKIRGSYTDLMSRSRFCLVAAGDGWSARFEDCILHGAIPVIVLDNTHGPFETLLDWPSFSIRVRENELDRMVDILTSIPVEKEEVMRSNLAKVWHRLRYNTLHASQHSSRSHAELASSVRGPAAKLTPGLERALDGVDDAFSTILQWLYVKIPQKSARYARELAASSSRT